MPIAPIIAWFTTSKLGQAITLAIVALLAILGLWRYAQWQGERREQARNAERVRDAEKKMRNIRVPRNEEDFIRDLERDALR